MRSSVGQCRNIRFRQLSASHVIITSVTRHADSSDRRSAIVAESAQNDFVQAVKKVSSAKEVSNPCNEVCLLDG